jgi:serine protease Do
MRLIIFAARILILFPSLLVSVAMAAMDPVAMDSILPDMIERNQPGVVNIQSTQFVRSYGYYGDTYDQFFSEFFGVRPQAQRQTSLGSGFIIDEEGYILTNHHVISNADEVVILQGTDKNPKQVKAKVIGTDPIIDLALLKLVNPPAKLKPLTLGDSDKIRVGQTAIAMGNPFGLSGTVTRGIVSSLHRSIGQGPYDDFLQTDASINFGNSGGPLFNIKGEVIGINTAIQANGRGIGFAIPINLVKRLVPQLKKDGRVIRSWLGMVGENNKPVYQIQFGISGEPGVVVYSLVARSPALRAGLKSGDVVTAVNGTRVDDIHDLQREVQPKKPGETVTLSVQRVSSRGAVKELKIKIKLEELPPSENLPEGYNFM